MKKIIALILVSVLCLGMLASCNLLNDSGLDAAANYLDELYEKKTVGGNDYDVVAIVKFEGTTYSVTWTVDNSSISIKESTKTGYYTVDLPEVNEAEAQYTLTATISNGKKSVTKTYTYTLPVIDSTGVTSTPVEGTAYKIFLLQGGMGQRFYALGSTQNGENKFVETTTNPKDGVDFYVEKSGNGYKFYTEINGVKNYLFAKVTKTVDESTGTTKYSKFIGYNTAEGSVFTYNEAKGGVWTVTVEGLVWGVGTYGTYTTISISEESYFTPEKVGTSQYVIQLMTSSYANTLEADKLPEVNSDAKAILDQLYALAKDESVKGNFKLTGKITSLDSYKNPTIVVEGYESQPVYCYRLTDDRFVEGAIITVSATEMKNYGGTYEFMNCTLENFTAGSSGSGSGSTGSGSTESKPNDIPVNTNPFTGTAADFDAMVKDTSYTTVNPKVSPDGWVAENCQIVDNTHTNSGSDFTVLGDHVGIVINGKTSAVGTVTSPTIKNGISALTFTYANFYSESNGVDITITIKYTENGESKSVTKTLDDDSVEKNVAETFTWTLDAAISGDFTIVISNNSPSNNSGNKDRVAIWNLSWVNA